MFWRVWGGGMPRGGHHVIRWSVSVANCLVERRAGSGIWRIDLLAA